MTDLAEKARQGDTEAFIELMNMNMQSMYKTAVAILKRDEDAADAIQDTILKCWENMGKLRKPEYFKTWMTKILVNNCRDRLRERQRTLPSDDIDMVSDENDRYLNAEWRASLESIEKKYRLILLLYYSDGYKTPEISKILGIPEATVRTRLARGREKYLKSVEGK